MKSNEQLLTEMDKTAEIYRRRFLPILVIGCSLFALQFLAIWVANHEYGDRLLACQKELKTKK